MNILMLTPYLPFPLWSGGQIRTFNLLKHLSKKHDITLYSFIREEREKDYVAILNKFCSEVRVFIKRPPWSATSLALAGITYYPLVVCMYLNREVKNSITEAISRKKFDLIHAETFYIMPNIPQNNIPIILAEQTIEYLVYRHHTKKVNFLPMKLLMELDVAKINFWEKRFWKRAKRVIAMSDSDMDTMQRRDSDLKVDLVPNGVDTEFFPLKLPRKKQPGRVKTILFVGNFKWLQNREAVNYLVRQVWPKIKAELPGSVRLLIVGRHPPAEINRLKSEDITIDSEVEDIRTAYRISDVLLAPIYGPGGTRYKILESMATGLPVVTTATGIEGLSAQNNRDALIADSPHHLAQATIKLLTDEKLYRKLAENGRKLVENNFSWQEISARLDRIYKLAV